MQHIDERRYLIPFRSLLLPQIFTDTLVIGAGVAGVRAALEAASHGDVIVMAKSAQDTSATVWAQGGIAAALGDNDTSDAHYQDTMSVGGGLCDAAAVRTLVDEGPQVVEELIEWGMRFDRDEHGAIDFAREAGHGHARILHAGGAATGRELGRCLAEHLAAAERVRVFDHCFALDLLTTDRAAERGSGRVVGAITHHARYGLQIIWARAVVLACGGAGQVYRETTNPGVSTGDGLAMAYRAGAAVADVEFMQFHPTTLYIAGAGRALISEAVRGEGAHLVDRSGQRFMTRYHEQAELAPRDVVSRAIVDELARTHGDTVYLDVRHLGRERFAERFPALLERLRSFDLDPAVDLIPVHPSAHYTIGGVWTDINGATTLPGLFACGEVAANGLHGANRLASNSLLEGLVFGRRTGRAAGGATEQAIGPLKIISEISTDEHGELDLSDVRSSLRSVMWRNVGIQRSGTKLGDVSDMFSFWARYTLGSIFDEPAAWEVQNMLIAGALITRAAAWRCETRGVHCRLDHPDADERFHGRALWRVQQPEPEFLPVERAAAVA